MAGEAASAPLGLGALLAACRRENPMTAYSAESPFSPTGGPAYCRAENLVLSNRLLEAGGNRPRWGLH